MVRSPSSLPTLLPSYPPPPTQPIRAPSHHRDMVMIASREPVPGYTVLDPQGHPLGRVELPRKPDLLEKGTVLLRREFPKIAN